MTKTKATEELLGQLHGELAQSYLDELKRYQDEGEPIPAALLNSIANFLKQNNIEADPSNSDMEELRDRAGNVLDFPFDTDAADAD